MAGIWVLLGTLVVATAAGLLLRRRDGRIKQPKPVTALPAPVAGALDPGAPVTLVQLSTTFCAPCRQTRALLTHLAGKTDGLAHVDLDVTNQPEVAQHLGVLRTPTTVAYAPDGRELLRVGGVPKAADLLEALEPYLKTSA
ncbi:TlpA family protein disulfide reductase [Amycolatopsis magusensis]|uniref:Thiol-disulfide isomerase/thioredoxin n=1 Tax=Amycolatopsis magusensis TaxID=882444 RepID=A0ABS4PKM9_9PSEU|nr:thioredoxin family protein [Amycolatopsis magusensis]MBP2179986.1 thiol-disulfide isomerase/thioredoxin [Amycolatopsis magusensis]